MYRINKFLFALFVSALLIVPSIASFAQTNQQQPLTSSEFVNLLYTLPRNPQRRDDVIEEIRRRGIGFPLTDGMRSLVATGAPAVTLYGRVVTRAPALTYASSNTKYVPASGSGTWRSVMRWRSASAFSSSGSRCSAQARASP